MSIKVCDALCGSGKTSAAIRMMNERTDCKFIFITQYLREVERIKAGCACRCFVEPETSDECSTKLSHLHELLRSGCNIATTHSLFSFYTEETTKLIEEQGYTLVLDEVVEVISIATLSRGDLDILIKSGSVIEDGEKITWTNEDYANDFEGRFREEMMKAKSNNFLKYDDKHYCWVIPPELFTSFEDVYVLTYMFYAQPLRNFFEMYGIEYEYIGTKLTAEGFQFCASSEMNRARSLKSKIHILEHKKVNQIGSSRSALSLSWYSSRYDKDNPDIDQMRKNLCNVFRNIWHARSNEILWTTFKEFQPHLTDRGYGLCFVPYNKRATNEYSDRRYLAYCINNFPRPWAARFFREHGSKIDHEGYALSILIQWIFRSAIRNGEEVWIYIPSARMRSLLKEWLDKLEVGRDLDEIKYKTPRRRPTNKKKNSSKESK